MKTYSADDVVDIIRKRTKESSLRQTARDLGLSASYLSDILLGRRDVSETVAEAFGYKREVVTEHKFTKID
jgi:transcriptional regulator with XRE-family HTH domain